ncbi:hypothetical protein HYH03_016486 [Edaphochlamys debaryana]|uniref:CCHC-type domain-containing protein n=1 Tax=Edaphochlamys debaryana TaxID=47281 RepID=A0A835XJT2_9CHLO|nr:hypothetical protein HYH03_016486 [Edaphochlamys debaryana]|eukprot:KAG2484739.1 hypothetical protein HYH03_016486 [Edaphochlamys debaryana]
MSLENEEPLDYELEDAIAEDGNALVTENQFAADPAACAEAAGAEVEAAAEPVAEPEADEADPGSDGGDFGFAEEAEPRCCEKAVRVACFISNKKLLEKYIIWCEYLLFVTPASHRATRESLQGSLCAAKAHLIALEGIQELDNGGPGPSTSGPSHRSEDGNTAKKPKLAAAATKPSLEEMFASATAKGLDLNEVLDMFKCTRKVYLTRKYNGECLRCGNSGHRVDSCPQFNGKGKGKGQKGKGKRA